MTHSTLVALDRTECLQLLAGATVGRVVHTDRALPACTPVNFRLVGEAVVFRTAASSRLAAATADAVVAFEVDDFDPAAGSGWTVLVTGVATAVRDVSTLVRLDQLGLVAWAGSDRCHWVRITVADVTGRRVVAPPSVTSSAAS
jgi:nitroimidazol reductase NimA-like FMN-containing flavoprotein (pyridoxamine 5'-phosphate oxidase superfamily)